MTPRQHQMVTFVRTYVLEHGYSPSNQEIALGIGLKSSSNVSALVDRLVDRGLLVRASTPGGSRGLRVPLSEYERGYQDGLWAARAKLSDRSAA